MISKECGKLETRDSIDSSLQYGTKSKIIIYMTTLQVVYV